MADRRTLTRYAWLSIAANMGRTGLRLMRRPGHGDRLLERIRQGPRGALPNCSVLTHLEPLEDPSSFEHVGLDRESGR